MARVLLGVGAEALDERELRPGGHPVGEEEAQEPLVAELEAGDALVVQPVVERAPTLAGEAVGLARAGAVRLVGAHDVAVLLERRELRVDLGERGRPEEAGAPVDGALDGVAGADPAPSIARIRWEPGFSGIAEIGLR